MTTDEFAARFLLNLPFDPNDQQVGLMAALSRFCSRDTPSDTVFLLAGYAGTGKTSVVGALVRTLREAGVGCVLMAPTGRAAKVFAAFAGEQASTIHRRIYRPPTDDDPYMSMRTNTLHDTIFIVDEASMIGSDAAGDGRPGLLDDLIHYVYTGEGCRLILLGDKAQLPPVGCAESPAMDPDVLRGFGLRVNRVILTETVRQTAGSGILDNATRLRRAMRLPELPVPAIVTRGYDDVMTLGGEDLAEFIESAYAADGIDETVVITRTNWRASEFNAAIRSAILYREEELCRDELLMVTKNNYYWSTKVRGLDFIANGDTARVERVYGTEERYGLRFADVLLRFPYRDVDVECKVVLDSLTSNSPSLTQEDAQKLFAGCLNDPDRTVPSMPYSVRVKRLRTDPYFNALQIKYGYAVTCHKAQGGQWRNVVVDLTGIPADALTTIELYRWLYTATTRATSCLVYLDPDGFRLRQ